MGKTTKKCLVFLDHNSSAHKAPNPVQPRLIVIATIIMIKILFLADHWCNLNPNNNTTDSLLNYKLQQNPMSRTSCKELITELNENDHVLCGRSGRISSYPGNVQFWQFCRHYHSFYISDKTKKTDKIKIISTIIEAMHNMMSPSTTRRFLEEDMQKDDWFKIDNEKAKRKTG